MMDPDQEKRPSVQDLLNFPQVSLRLREKRLKEQYYKLKKREEELKKKESKFKEMENENTLFNETLKRKNKELDEKDKIIEELNRKLSLVEGSNHSSIDTQKLLGERKSSFRDKNSRFGDSSSVYPSLKQEIQDLTSKLSYETSISTKLKKQTSCLAPKNDELSVNNSCEREARKGLRDKTNLGYKSCERKRRTYDQKISSQKPYDYRKSSRARLGDASNKENVSQNRMKQRDSSERINSSKEEYTTPPFKSYKSKIASKENDRIRTTSYRSRSGIYTSGSQQSRGLGYKTSEGVNKSYIATKESHANHFVLRRELSNN